jgi:hypothetical protein
MVIQQSMARIPSFYHASASIQPANHSDFFNTHRRLRSKPLNERYRDLAPIEGTSTRKEGKMCCNVNGLEDVQML